MFSFRKGIIRFIPFFILTGILCSCGKPAEKKRAFYHWKQTWQPGDFELRRLNELKIDKIYLKLFDVVSENGISKPVAILNVKSAFPPQSEIIPVVYISNSVLKNKTQKSVDTLAGNIATLIEGICTAERISFKELQFDCDWDDKTKENYFKLLQILRIKFNQVQLSATIRLHQVKYRQITGIPPVERGMLMYYNMGKLQDPTETNSILNLKAGAKYISKIDEYPLPLDLALPAFSWFVHIRNGRVTGIENKIDLPDSLIEKKSGNYYQVTTSFLYQGAAYVKGDLLRKESVTSELIQNAVKQLKPELKNQNYTVALFHLDSLQQSQYSTPELNEIFSAF
jgi:hypothetical protein